MKLATQRSASGLHRSFLARKARIAMGWLAAWLLALSVPAFGAESAQQFVNANAAGPADAPTWHVVPKEVDGPVGPETPQDHSKFKQLQGPFTSPEQVTRACLSCHTQAAKQVMSTIHWTWKAWNPKTKQMVGKNEIYNTFCVSPISNEQFCTVCHAGYGSQDPDKFIPFSQRTEDHVDCLVCHDKTKTYRKIPFIGGNPALAKIAVRPGCNEVYGTDKAYVEPEDLAAVAKRVGAPTRYTCGICHFYGGGGDGVKHGDLDSSLNDPPRALDVHMDAKGLNFSCQECHKTTDHNVSGEHYAIDADPKQGAYMRGAAHNGNAVTCQSCHGQAPHVGDNVQSSLVASTLNMHTRDIACETCHIPQFARGGLPTKMDWNYATAGKLAPNGSPLVIMNARGWNTYWGVKGSFRWAENVVPQYRWFNGTETWMHIGEKIQNHEKNGVVQVNAIEGSPTDGQSKIWPFKIHHNNQPYDTRTGILAIFHSFGFDEDSYTMNYNWNTSIATGMKAAHLPYSGHYGFVKTEMYWPIAHMVAPKENALRCVQCHADQGRLQNIDGVYMPGRPRDHQPLIERLGLLVAALALAGVVIHALIRIGLWLRRR
ncbi:tetrathionate reductase family octaheme c-type cytochrome [Thiomonas sp. FB-Cd]|uniref:tetrathionate reductase family octaheme c-type cytochrome n=1 Tax=Thiomonas sp. FB-Cd TaxID=1158292 RepID=UPI0006902090|nr:tetrathionate reductase family octaheme c-type cytochrome [Thiomonas sp. FB-Cd]